MGEVFFNVDIKKDEEFLIVSIEGKLVFPEADHAESSIIDEIRKNNSDIIFDFNNCDFIASSGYAIFIRLKKECDEKNLRIAFANCQENVKRGFFVIGYQNIIKFFDTIDEAKQYLRK